MPAPPLRIACCLCSKPIPLKHDIYGLDEEWQRRYPNMVGILACRTCALNHNWTCRTPDGAYVAGHRPAAGKTEAQDHDAWCHVEGFGTHTAMVYSHPWSAVQQGAEHWLRYTVQRPRLSPETAQRIRAALDRWDTRAAGQ